MSGARASLMPWLSDAYQYGPGAPDDDALPDFWGPWQLATSLTLIFSSGARLRRSLVAESATRFGVAGFLRAVATRNVADAGAKSRSYLRVGAARLLLELYDVAINMVGAHRAASAHRSGHCKSPQNRRDP